MAFAVTPHLPLPTALHPANALSNAFRSIFFIFIIALIARFAPADSASFSISSIPAGTTYVMRGVVELQWRGKSARKGRRFDMARRPGTLRRSNQPEKKTRSRKKAGRSQHAAVVRKRTLLTKTGMKGVQGGDPAGLSKAMCLIW